MPPIRLTIRKLKKDVKEGNFSKSDSTIAKSVASNRKGSAEFSGRMASALKKDYGKNEHYKRAMKESKQDTTFNTALKDVHMNPVKPNPDVKLYFKKKADEAAEKELALKRMKGGR